jgi:putative methylase
VKTDVTSSYCINKLSGRVTVRRKHLEILLSSLKQNPEPKLRYEEYCLDPISASTVLHLAFSMRDIEGKYVVDLGCGSGILSIGAALIGAKRIVGIDIDKDSINVAFGNMKRLGVRVELVAGSIECVRPSFDTTIMNPPFGSWRRGLDMEFLAKALEISCIVYTMHKANEKSNAFLRKKMKEMGGDIRKLGRLEITIPRLFKFHQKVRYKVIADLYRITRRTSPERDSSAANHLIA